MKIIKRWFPRILFLCICFMLIFYSQFLANQYKEYAEAEISTQQTTIKHLQLQIENLTKENNNLQSQIQTINQNFYERLNNLSPDEQFYVAAQVYDIDYKLVLAIARHETGNFSSELFISCNNPGGIRYSDGWASFDTQFEGIMEMCRLLKYYYIDYGLTTPETIGTKYCPDTAEDWANKVKTIMLELD